MKPMRTWSLAADFQQMDLIVNEACGFLREHSVPSESELFAFELCLREVLNNAIIHGVEAVSGSVGCLTLSFLHHTVDVLVCYNGSSFDLPDWSAEAPVLSENGRGFPILLNYCRHITYDRRKNCLNYRQLLQKIVSPQGELSVMSKDELPAFHVLRSDERIVLLMALDLIASNVQTIKTHLLETLKGCNGSVVFDLSKVRMVDSSGISLMIATYNSLKTRKQEFSVTGVSLDIHQLLCAMRLDRHFKVIPEASQS